jgi:hypothetical protein
MIHGVKKAMKHEHLHIPKAIYIKEKYKVLNATDRELYMILYDQLNKDGKITYSKEQLMELMGASEPTVRRAINSLKGVELIEYEKGMFQMIVPEFLTEKEENELSDIQKSFMQGKVKNDTSPVKNDSSTVKNDAPKKKHDVNEILTDPLHRYWNWRINEGQIKTAENLLKYFRKSFPEIKDGDPSVLGALKALMKQYNELSPGDGLDILIWTIELAEGLKANNALEVNSVFDINGRSNEIRNDAIESFRNFKNERLAEERKAAYKAEEYIPSMEELPEPDENGDLPW